MEEDNQDACGTEILDGKEIDMEERPAESAPIGELVAHQLVGQIPSHHQAGEESAYRQEHLTCDEVEDVEQGLTKERQVLNVSQRRRAERAHQAATRRDYLSCAVAGDAKLLLKECRADLMEGYQGSKGGKGEKGIEHQPHDIADYRH